VDVGNDLGHGIEARRVGLVDHDDIGHPDVDLARVVAQLVAGPQRIGDGDQQIGRVERRVVVASVPDDDVGLAEDRLVVDTGVHDHAYGDGRLAFLALLEVGSDASMSASVAKRWTRICSRSP
jgi:hypothetical protein